MKLSVHLQLSLLTLVTTSASPLSLAANVSETSDTRLEGQLDALVVTGQTYRNTATKTQLDTEETPQAISVIDQNALQQRGTETVAEAVRYASGINTELRGGAVTRLDFFNIRGFKNDKAYYDGLQLLYNDWNLQPQIDMAAVEQVEVFKGPTSTLYGAMPPGGMVNLISKVPQSDSQHSVELTLGSDSKRETQIDSTGAINDKLNYRVVGLFRQKDGQAVTSEEERIMIAPSIDWKISDDTMLNLNMYYQQDPKMGVYSSLPSKGTVYNSINGKLPSDAYSGDTNWETYDRDVLLLGYKLDHNINNTWRFLQNARFTTAKAYQENTYSSSLDSDERTLNRRAYLTDEKSEGINIDSQFSGLFDIGNAEHNILVGLDYLKLKSNVIYEDALAPSIDLYNPDHEQIIRDNLNFAGSGYSSDFTIDKEQTGMYLQDQIRLDQWVLIAGGRYDQFKATEKGRKYGATTNTKVDQSQFSGRAGALYEFANGIAPFVSYAQSFEPITGADRNGKTFDTSTAEQWEAGLKYKRRNITASATAFEIVKSKVLTRDPNGSAYDKIQVGEMRSRGIELELQQALTSDISLKAAYTLQDVEVTKDNSGIEGNTPVWVPKKQFNTWLTYAPTEGKLAGASFGAGARYVGQMQLDAANSNTVPSYTLVDLSIGYDLAMLSKQWQGASVRFSMSNVFDETYYSCYDESNCWFGDERAFEVSARYEF
ncbi:TonB-dependent siderophore receptor [Marinomonas foliarum]|uniref:Iron complex outermembrane receptor protein n=1 Tax=Marinomonas foliarum TaxID=491950 RepID=A0A369ALS5_9GAMM|nr:TonB-dependent siderophore receptor [Marinomonas foliarum]RCX08374.1 iron complex outermembrane receptor protein [Marinomonas foliarum]